MISVSLKETPGSKIAAQNQKKTKKMLASPKIGEEKASSKQWGSFLSKKEKLGPIERLEHSNNGTHDETNQTQHSSEMEESKETLSKKSLSKCKMEGPRGQKNQKERRSDYFLDKKEPKEEEKRGKNKKILSIAPNESDLHLFYEKSPNKTPEAFFSRGKSQNNQYQLKKAQKKPENSSKSPKLLPHLRIDAELMGSKSVQKKLNEKVERIIKIYCQCQTTPKRSPRKLKEESMATSSIGKEQRSPKNIRGTNQMIFSNRDEIEEDLGKLKKTTDQPQKQGARRNEPQTRLRVSCTGNFGKSQSFANLMESARDQRLPRKEMGSFQKLNGFYNGGGESKRKSSVSFRRASRAWEQLETSEIIPNPSEKSENDSGSGRGKQRETKQLGSEAWKIPKCNQAGSPAQRKEGEIIREEKDSFMEYFQSGRGSKANDSRLKECSFPSILFKLKETDGGKYDKEKKKVLETPKRNLRLKLTKLCKIPQELDY